MTFIEKLKTVERVDQLIRLKATGTPDDLASKLNVTRSTVYEIIECMKAMDAEIKYCKSRKSFYYETEKVLAIGFVEKDKIKGGEKINFGIFENNFQRPIFSDRANIYL
jgi:Mn-dependent DtxR family transcriptional regulator